MKGWHWKIVNDTIHAGKEGFFYHGDMELQNCLLHSWLWSEVYWLWSAINILPFTSMQNLYVDLGQSLLVYSLDDEEYTLKDVLDFF